LISQQGLSKAFESYATSIFDRETVESVVRSGGMTTALLSPKQNILLPTGQAGLKTTLSNNTSVLFDSQGKFIGFERQGVTQLGKFGITNTGDFGLQEGQIFGATKDGSKYQGSVKDGQAITLTIQAGNNEIKIKGKNESSIVFDQTGQIIDGSIDLGRSAYTFVINAGNLSDLFVSTAQAAELTVVMPNGEIFKPTPLDPIKPDIITRTKTREKNGPVQFLARFMNQQTFNEVNDEGLLIRANTDGKIFTTNTFYAMDTPEYAATSLQLGNSATGMIDPTRAKYFVVFDTEGLNPPPPDPTNVVKKYSGNDQLLPSGSVTGRQEVVFTDRPFIDLKEAVSSDIRLIHMGLNTIFERIVALFKMGARGSDAE